MLPSCVSLYRDSPQPCQLGIHLTKVISSVFLCQCFCLFLFLSVCLRVKLRKHVLSCSTVEFEQTDFCQDRFIALSFPWSGAPSRASVSICIHLNCANTDFFWPLGGSANTLCKQHWHIHEIWALVVKQLPPLKQHLYWVSASPNMNEIQSFGKTPQKAPNLTLKGVSA